MALPFHLSGGTLLLVKRYAIKIKNIYLMGPATVSRPRSSLAMAVAIARAARALGVGPKADATTNQFRARRKVCSHCRECGDAASVQVVRHGCHFV
jgi:hypothetical protein